MSGEGTTKLAQVNSAHFWSQTVSHVLTALQTDVHHGLSHEEAKRRLERSGLNELHQADRPSAPRVWLAQLNSPFVYILILAALITVAERQMVEFGVIMGVVVINTAIGFAEEWHAERIILKLRGLITPMARVI